VLAHGDPESHASCWRLSVLSEYYKTELQKYKKMQHGDKCDIWAGEEQFVHTFSILSDCLSTSRDCDMKSPTLPKAESEFKEWWDFETRLEAKGTNRQRPRIGIYNLSTRSPPSSPSIANKPSR
jgi:hypothetical protein